MDFKLFDCRHYPTVNARTGYGEWAQTYESSVPNRLDLHVLEQLASVGWEDARSCLDLACGTGRIGQWLRGRGVSPIDGVDITPQMLEKAAGKSLYRVLSLGSVEETEIAGARYDLLVMSLADEHLATLQPVYAEAFRLSVAGARFVVVGMHPWFFMTGMPTHFRDRAGDPKALETHVHLVSEHIGAALAAGWRLREMYEGVIDEEWIEIKPKWEKFRGYPVNYGYVWER